MNLKDYALSTSGYSVLKSKCLHYALTYGLNFSDLLSYVHEKVTLAFNRDIEINQSDNHAKATIITIIRNSAIDLTRKPYSRNEKSEENDVLGESSSGYCSNNYETKDLFNFVDTQIRNKFRDKPIEVLIYQNCILGGLTYDKFSEENDVLPCTVRTKARCIKQFAKSLKEIL